MSKSRTRSSTFLVACHSSESKPLADSILRAGVEAPGAVRAEQPDLNPAFGRA